MEKAVATSERPMGAGESLRRVLECVASGILLEGKLHTEMSNQHGCLCAEIKIFANTNVILCVCVQRWPWNQRSM